MKISAPLLALSVMVLAVPMSGATAPAPATGVAAAPAPTVATATDPAIPLSQFTIPATPKEGRNPFFPNSRMNVPVAPKTAAPAATVDTSALVLNGITSPPKRTAMINGYTFEIGEEHEVKTSTGRVLVKCVEVKDDSAVIVVSGQQRVLKLRFGL